MAVPGKKTRLFVETPNSNMAIQTGLMFRKHLAKNAGMLFRFSSNRRHSFWMKNTYLSLDIAFIASDGKIVDIQSLIPLSTRAVRPPINCRYAIETNRGWFRDNGISIGTYVGQNSVKTAQAPEGPSVALYQDFKKAVITAVENNWDILIDYLKRPVEYKRGKPVPRKDTDRYRSNVRFLLSGDAERLPESGKYFEYVDKGNGEFIRVRIGNESGAIKNYFVDGIVEYRFLTPEGVKYPYEVELERRQEVPREFPEFEKVSPEETPDISFWGTEETGESPFKQREQAPPAAPAAKEPEPEPERPGAFRSMWDYLRKTLKKRR